MHSAAWLASGSAGGMVRIDNTMLRRTEGGGDNKLAYDLEPYILKKRRAQDGTKIGKIGRPRKQPEATIKKRGRPKTSSHSTKLTLKATTKSLVTGSEDSSDDGVESEYSASREFEQERQAAPLTTGTHDEEIATMRYRSSRVMDQPTTRRSTPKSRLSTSPPIASENNTTRQSTRLAPIFTRALSSGSLTGSGQGSRSEKRGISHQENEPGSECTDSASRAQKTASRDPRTPTKSIASSTSNHPSSSTPRRRGRPLKVSALTVTDKTSSNGQTMLQITRTPLQDDEAGGSAGNEHGASVGVPVEEGLTVATTSFQAQQPSPITPDSPRKKRGLKARKRGEDLDRQSHSLRDLWGVGKGADTSDAPTKPE